MRKVLICAVLPLFIWSCSQPSGEKSTETGEQTKTEEKKPSDYDKPELEFTPVETKNKLIPVDKPVNKRVSNC